MGNQIRRKSDGESARKRRPEASGHGELPTAEPNRSLVSSPAAIINLQHTIGNAAVQRLLVARDKPPGAPLNPRGGPFAKPDKFKLPDVPNLELPTVSDPNKEMVVIDDQDTRSNQRIERGKVRQSPDYVDNAVASVGVSQLEFWTTTIQEFEYRFADTSRPPLRVPLGEIDPTAYMPSTQYIKKKGVIFPLDSQGSLAFDDENTPRIARGALMKLGQAEKVRSVRRQMSALVMAFQMITASIALATIGSPAGNFAGGTLLSARRVAGGSGMSFSFASNEAWIYQGRMVRVVNTPTGPRAFYRRTGDGGSSVMGAQPGDWVPFLGFKPNPGGAQFVKPPSAVNLSPSTPLTLYRWGNEEALAASGWIQAQHRYASPLAINVGENWGRIQSRLEKLGVFVEFPVYR